MRTARWWFTASALLWLHVGSAGAQSPDETIRADEMYGLGQAAFDAGNYAEALVHLQQSFELVASPDTLLGIAACYEMIGVPDEAKTRYQQVLEDPRASAELRRVAAEGLARAGAARPDAPPETPPPAAVAAQTDAPSAGDQPTGLAPLPGAQPTGLAPRPGDDTTAFLHGQEGPRLIAAPEQDPDAQLEEDPNKAYFLIGLRSYFQFIPSGLIEAFGLAQAPEVTQWALGLEFTYRKNAFDIVTSVWWADYGAEGYVWEEGDPETEIEWMKSTLGVIWFTVDFMAGTDFYPWFGLQYGGGIGFGVTTGDIERREAYRDAGGDLHPCNGPEDPDTTFCESAAAGGHYELVPRAADGVWPVYPVISGKLSLRWKPLPNLVINVPDLGLGLPSLFFVGGRVNYMF
jgi:hypothetical protein